MGIGAYVFGYVAVWIPDVENGATLEYFGGTANGTVFARKRNVEPADGGLQYVSIVQGSHRKDANNEGSPSATVHLWDVHVRVAFVGVYISQRYYEQGSTGGLHPQWHDFQQHKLSTDRLANV